MTAITFEFDDDELRRKLDEVAKRLDDMTPVMDAIGAGMVSNILLNLGDGKQYDGAPMEPLKQPRRRQGKGRFGDVPLNDTRQHTYNKITHTADAHSVAIGMNENVGIGAIHQFGGQAGRGRKVTIPPRPFLPIKNNQVDLPRDWAEEVHATVEAALRKVLP